MQELIPVVFNEQLKVNSVDARTLWKAVGSDTAFKDWILRRLDYTMAVEGEDYILQNDDKTDKSYSSISIAQKRAMVNTEKLTNENVNIIAKFKRKNYILSVHLAKEFAMLERNETGKKVRKYFIECEGRLIDELSKPKIIQQPLITIPRFKNDSVSSAHKELMSQFKSTFISIYKRIPTNEEYGKFVAGVNKKVFGYHEKGMRGNLTSHGYVVAINTFDEICRSLKGSRNIGNSVQSSVDRINLELKEVKFPELATEPFALITNGTELVA